MKIADEIQYRWLALSDLEPGLLRGFTRTQQVNEVWRTLDGERKLVLQPFIDDWERRSRKRL
ncbi:hypothetical protein [Paenibacillus donghaensis]|uniref:Uncharacterized protein n=1 Tax=Paenibacillus donghaensis TaxID=414771 RepID=A0A2Z2KH23_9BACL|nr:hypothetical protein [Paenibacillus donghaensis]ASA22533.1 hypothetical protein B9T62_18145 [Paenibacillus donghaensis]